MSFQSFESEISFAGISLELHSFLVRENSKSILISPVQMTDQEIQKIKSEGGVTDIVAPTLIHHLYIQKAMEAFPDATLWGVEGFEKKRPDLKWDKVLTKTNWPYADFLDVIETKGAPRLNEAIFLHKKTNTLIVADICFNIQNPKGILSTLLMIIFGNYKKFNVSKLIYKWVKDKNDFRQSMAEVFKWDFDRVAMSHGKLVETGGKELLRAALQKRGLL